MCLTDRRLTRRYALSVAAVGLLLPLAGRRSNPKSAEPTAGLSIHPRDDWGAGLPPVGALQPETDVRFLLVHHTAGRTEYRENAVVDQIQEVYRYHTSLDKGWADVCYNFFIDRFGGVWEGRQGSANGPVAADATGGSQGYAQLVCLLGNFHENRPTDEMIGSLQLLLAHLADRHSLDTTPGATTSFVSKGSNKWPEGSPVTASIISGHRDMSSTVCPGDYVYPLLAGSVSEQVHLLSSAVPAATTETAPTTAPTSTPPATVAPTVPSPSASPPRTTPTPSPQPTTTSDTLTTTTPATEAAKPDEGGASGTTIATGIAIGGAAVAAGALVAAVRQRKVDGDAPRSSLR
ncbi:peptidoglycan recognition family protein [Gemmatimonas sp.]|uniref:peptidoglycan recognition protein family protein n=1 Tax=Gemmatimonas sp. TaxID=1962908 RepID=UPI0035676609